MNHYQLRLRQARLNTTLAFDHIAFAYFDNWTNTNEWLREQNLKAAEERASRRCPRCKQREVEKGSTLCNWCGI